MKLSVSALGPLALAGLAALALSATPAAAQSPEKVMQRLAELDIEFAGIGADIADRQNLGRREVQESAGDNRGALADRDVVVFAWDVQRSPDDRVSDEKLLSIEHLQAAGIPAVHGGAPDLTRGYGNQRYRMGGTITNIEIGGDDRYEVRMNIDWEVYDSQSSSVVWEGSSTKLARGAALGDRGESDNVLLDAVLGALDAVLDDEVPDAID